MEPGAVTLKCMLHKTAKEKMITVRLSSDEYKTLHNAFCAQGARNFSDFARMAMRQAIGKAIEPEDPLATKLHELEGRITSVELDVIRLLEQAKVV